MSLSDEPTEDFLLILTQPFSILAHCFSSKCQIQQVVVFRKKEYVCKW